MPERLVRARPVDLEVRGGDGRTVCGIACPFDSPTDIGEPGFTYTEVFRRGAFAKTIAERGPERIKAFAQHQRTSLPIGRASVLREDAAGLYSELRVSKTTAGDEALELVRDGALDGLSIGFQGIKDRQVRGGVERLEVALHEISLVTFPAYRNALVSSVRSHEPYLTPEMATRRLSILDAAWRNSR